VVDTLGLVMVVVIHAANIQDRDGAKLLLRKLVGQFSLFPPLSSNVEQ
jgi:putative transposase